MGYWGDMPHNNLDLPRICLAVQASHWDKAPQLALSTSVSGQWSTESMTRSDLYVVLKPVSVDVRQGSREEAVKHWYHCTLSSDLRRVR